MKIFVLSIFLLIGICHSQPNTNCSQLGFSTARAPFPGTMSSLCGDLGSSQCCTPNFLSMTAETVAERGLKEALRDELNTNDMEYEAISTNLTQYFSTRFIERIAASLPFTAQFNTTSLQNLTRFIANQLIPNLRISSPNMDGFNAEEYLNETVKQFIRNAVVSFGNATGTNAQFQFGCIDRTLRRGINDTIKSQLARFIQTIRRSVSALSRIQSFTTSQKGNIMESFTPVRGCIERLARQSFCGRCTQHIPPLCRGTCNALVRGCLSPVYSAYRRDFRQLWNVSRAILTQLERTVRSFFTDQKRLVNDHSGLLWSLVMVCGVEGLPTLPPSVTAGPTQPGTMGQATEDNDDDDDERRRIFGSLRERLDSMGGIFEYGNDGPEYCRPTSTERDYCRDSQRDNTRDRSCVISEICTSTCRCWDGNQMRDTDSRDFTRSGVADQRDNAQVDGLQSELIAQANQLGTSTPANVFLSSSEFMEVLPEGIEIPEADPFTIATDVTTTGVTGGAVRGVVSLIVMVTAVLASLVL